jgi:hypothetical protein
MRRRAIGRNVHAVKNLNPHVHDSSQRIALVRMVFIVFANLVETVRNKGQFFNKPIISN